MKTSYLGKMIPAIISEEPFPNTDEKEVFKWVNLLTEGDYFAKCYPGDFSTKLLHQLNCFSENFHGCSRYFEIFV